MRTELFNYRTELHSELQNILGYWVKYTVDDVHGGFVGRIDNGNLVCKNASKGSVLNSRILWSFSAAYNLTKKVQYLQMGERAFKYIKNYFIDKDYGGVYWTVDFEGNPDDTKKQIYALSFAVYGLSEYYKASEDELAKTLAKEMYETMVRYSYDKINGGYTEALTREWNEIEDLRLSNRDLNERKSMNTHLHVLEGFANLYSIWPDELLKGKIVELIDLFLDHTIDSDSHHLILFFNDKWNAKSEIVSYGHDIEAAWLLQEAAEIIKNKELIEKVKQRSVKVALAAIEGLDKDGGLWYEYDKHLVREKHWWPQAEAMVGFFNAWQTTGSEFFLQQSLSSWQFVKQHLIDTEHGEWFWGVQENYAVMKDCDKVGLWKCPYHNSRACIEIIKRID